MTMRRIDLQPLEPFTSDFIDRTGAFNPGALEAATAIIEQVRRDGDAALRALTEKFDGVAIENFRVPGEAIDAAMAEVDPDTLEALKHAAAQIRDFHERQKQQSWFFAREDGAIVGSKVTPLESVGIYVPGGRGRLRGRPQPHAAHRRHGPLLFAAFRGRFREEVLHHPVQPRGPEERRARCGADRHPRGAVGPCPLGGPAP